MALTLLNRPELVWLGEEVRMEVTDEHGTLLFTVIIVGIDAPGARHLA
ncbi:MAG TPA: hypothetical protein VEZ70_01230 [Allosphingosinicella sp.]|nr:hypothetical protein [Allosphingosinicella sp.]